MASKPTTGKFDTRKEWENEVLRLNKRDVNKTQIAKLTGTTNQSTVSAFLAKNIKSLRY